VVVRTGDDETAGTDAKVYLQIFGDIGETEPLLLDTTQSGNNTFEPAQTNEFDLQAVNVGQVFRPTPPHCTQHNLHINHWKNCRPNCVKNTNRTGTLYIILKMYTAIN